MQVHKFTRLLGLVVLVLLLPWIITQSWLAGGRNTSVSKQVSASFSYQQTDSREVSMLTTKSKKPDQIAEVLNVANNLSRIAQSYAERNRETGDIDDKTRLLVFREVERIKSLENLLALARICQAIFGKGEAGDASYDNVFDEAYRHCVKMLADNTTDEAVLLLRLLKTYSNADAGEALFLNKAIASQQIKRDSSGKVRKD